MVRAVIYDELERSRSIQTKTSQLVMAGLVPAISLRAGPCVPYRDRRGGAPQAAGRLGDPVKPGDDDGECGGFRTSSMGKTSPMGPTALAQIPIPRRRFAAFGWPQIGNNFSCFTVEILPNELPTIGIHP